MHLLGHLGSRAAEPERERAAPAAVAKSTASTASGIAGWKVDPNPRNLRRRAHAAAACDGRPLVLTQLLAPLVPYAEGVRVRKHGVAAALRREGTAAPTNTGSGTRERTARTLDDCMRRCREASVTE